MISYFLVGFSFLLAIVGGLFETSKKDEEGVTIRGFLGMPSLTTPGRIWLAITVLSFAFTFYSTFKSNGTTDKMSADLADARKNLHDVSSELVKANELSQHLSVAMDTFSLENLQDFKDVNDKLTATGNRVTGQLQAATESLSEGLDKSLVDLNQSIRGDSTLVDGFDVQVFSADVPTTPADVAREGSLKSMTNLGFRSVFPPIEAAVCNAPVEDTDVYIFLPLARKPGIRLAVFYKKHSGGCERSIQIQTDRQVEISTKTLGGNYYGKPCDVFVTSGFGGMTTGTDLKSIVTNPTMLVSGFWSTFAPWITVDVPGNEDANALFDYLKATLPRVIGFRIEPMLKGRTMEEDLEIRAAFALKSLVREPPSDKSAGFARALFYFGRTEMLPQWSLWDYRNVHLVPQPKGRSKDNSEQITTAYKAFTSDIFLSQPGRFDGHLTQEQAMYWGRICSFGQWKP
jgi:hypothetical protein